MGKNVFQSTTSGTLGATCDTTSFSNEPTGVAINPNNNHIFFSDDSTTNDKIYEVTLGGDGTYCTADDTVTSTGAGSLYGATDAEDVAYGITPYLSPEALMQRSTGSAGRQWSLGGGDDGAMTHFDTAALGFHDLEGIGYNADNGTLFIISTQAAKDTWERQLSQEHSCGL
jgi:hypothetical protein